MEKLSIKEEVELTSHLIHLKIILENKNKDYQEYLDKGVGGDLTRDMIKDNLNQIESIESLIVKLR